MLRVVLDTNVLVSALISDGKPRELFRKGIENQFLIVTSDPMLKELLVCLVDQNSKPIQMKSAE